MSDLIPSTIQDTTEMLPSDVDIDSIIDAYSSNLLEFEGNLRNASFAHKPTAGSGITIAQGLDSKFTSRDKMFSLGVPERILKQMDTFGAFTKGTSAAIPSNVRLERMTKEEFNTVSRNIANQERNSAILLKTSNPSLSDQAVGILLSIKHWAGGFESPNESKVTRYTDNIDTGKAVETGDLISPIAEVLKTGQATDQDLITAMEIIRDSYIPWGAGKDTARYRTLDKYIKRLK